MKKTIIATAVSAALMVPVAAQAEVTVYGRIHNGIKFVSVDGKDSTTDLNGAGGRFGIKASSDLGNGMTVSGHYEFKASTDKPGEGDETTRVATVGVSGGLGSVKLGVQQWGAFYSTLNTSDYTYTSPGILYYDIGPSRTSNTIKYSNSLGPISFQLDARVNDSDEDHDSGYSAGATFAVNDMVSIAGAIDDNDTRTVTGVQGRVDLGNYYVALGRFANDPDAGDADPSLTQAWVGGSWGNTSAQIGMGRGDKDTGGMSDNPTGTTLGVYHSLGGGLTLMLESGSTDQDGAGADSSSHWLGMMYNF